ncbi:MAG: hypothetical protein KC933_02575 [Myxococcales bacterium]|nr:hypothetical protein [Myxococcales bacterium]
MDARAPTHPYWAAIVDQAPRVLGLMDREALSPTSGCGDRTYWAWKFTDFPGARFQESLCVLSFLYSTPGSEYFKNPNLLTWIGRGMEYWCKIQYKDGSFDEAYPFERSLAATAFTGFYVGEGFRMVQDDLPDATRARVKVALRRAGDWLVGHDEHHGFLSNHLAAAAAALMNMHLITRDPRYLERCQYFVNKILSHQSPEGWYDEYGGADPGYQTHGTFYLARIHQLRPEPRLLESIERSMRFLANFIHVDGSLGGEYTSRNTQTYYPAAFEMLQSSLPIASWIAERMRPAVASASAAGLRSVDAYNYYPFLNNLVFAHQAFSDADRDPKPPEGPSEAEGLTWFPAAGLARVRTARYDAYVGTRKGGVVKVFDRQKGALVYNDCGYIGRLEGGGFCSSQYEDGERKVSVTPEVIEVEGAFAAISKPVMNPLKFMAFRAFNLTAGQVPALAFWMKNLLVKTLIYRKKPLSIAFKRRIELGASSVRVTDNLEGPDASKVVELRWEPVFTTIHMGSSRYFVPNELEVAFPESASDEAHALDPRRVAAGVRLERNVTFSSPEGEVVE